MDLSVLIVNYNTREKTLACLQSVERETRGLEYEVLVLDNASGDGSAAAIRAGFPGLHLDVQRENLGFARGINRLARAARGEFLLLLNPDTELQSGAIQELVAFARERPAPGIHGGRTVHPDGSPDPGFAWGRATLWSTFCNAVGLAGLFARSALFNPEGVGMR
ncbi:MAG: glycosyltransferase, partial [Planctomycetes bacterium]|nr:glycosyltransferase [Planctomycetota bacterium]